MGIWGTGIRQSDEFLECYDAFFAAYTDGKDPSALADEIWNSYTTLFSEAVPPEGETDLMHTVRFALAQCLWECGVRQHALISEVRTIIEQDLNLRFWRAENGGSDQLAAARKRELLKFWGRLQTEPKRIRGPKKSAKPRSPSFHKGDVFAYRNPEGGGFRAAIILDRIETDCLIAVADPIYAEAPPLEDFLDSTASLLFWVWEKEVLPKKNRIFLGNLPIADSYNGRAGYMRGADGSLALSNPGTRDFFFAGDYAKSRMKAKGIGSYPIRKLLVPDLLPKAPLP